MSPFRLWTTAVVSLFISIVVPFASVYSVDLFGACKSGGTDCTAVKQNNLDYTTGSNSVWKTVSFALGILGALAVIMIIVGGIRYTTSNGDASRIKAAKDTIMYSVVGLVVALIASTIIAFVNQYFG